jgi:hypothetical protein
MTVKQWKNEMCDYRTLANELGIGTSHTERVINFLVLVRLGDLVCRDDRRRLDDGKNVSDNLLPVK